VAQLDRRTAGRGQVPYQHPPVATAGDDPSVRQRDSLTGGGGQEPIVKLVVSSAVESLPTNTSIVVVSITQSRTAAFQ
jgi:hypothetical protein